MNEPKTLALLYDCIEKEYQWRIIELSSFRSAVLTATGNAQKGMIRAGIALLYAHWEGFIKKCADLYYAFVSFQNCKINQLSDCFVSIALRSEIDRLQNTKKLLIHTEIIKIFFENQNKIAYFSATSPIRTSNLKYDVFEDVCIMIGIDIAQLEEQYKQKRRFDRNIEKTINEDLVNKRNFIAHGDYLPITEKEYKELYDVIINGLLYVFKEKVMDAAQNKKYLRSE
jgi:MAE_28990/MAE_18760-like HEPN